MKRKKSLYKQFIFILMLVFASACSKVKSDARKAAKLSNKSVEKMQQLKMDDAEKLFLKSQAIIEKYESHKKSQKFLELYQQHRDKDKKNDIDTDK